MGVIKTTLYAVLLASFLFVGFFSFYGDLIGVYRPDVEDTIYNNTYDFSSEIGDLSQSMLGELNTTTTTETDAISQMTKGSWSAIKIFFTSLDYTYKMVSFASEKTGVPPWMIPVAISAITIAVVTGLIGIFFKREL